MSACSRLSSILTSISSDSAEEQFIKYKLSRSLRDYYAIKPSNDFETMLDKEDDHLASLVNQSPEFGLDFGFQFLSNPNRDH